MSIELHYTSGLIEIYDVSEKDPSPFPYMAPLETRSITQSFKGTGSGSYSTVGYLGKAPDGGVCLAMAGGLGWTGFRRDGTHQSFADSFSALVWSGQLPWQTDEMAIVGTRSTRFPFTVHVVS